MLSVFAQLRQRGDDPQPLRRLHQRAALQHRRRQPLVHPRRASNTCRLSQDQQTFDEDAAAGVPADHRGLPRRHAVQHPDGRADGLITQGDPTTQLTWMDAKCGDIAFTPRQGKAGRDQRALVSRADADGRERRWPAKVTESFRKAFWISPFRGLADVVSDDGTADTSIRPNQIFAVEPAQQPADARSAARGGRSRAARAAHARRPAHAGRIAIRNIAAATPARSPCATTALSQRHGLALADRRVSGGVSPVNKRSPRVDRAGEGMAPRR